MLLPEAFVKQIIELLGDEAKALFVALEEPAPVSIRLNPLKTLDNRQLNKFFTEDDVVPWSSCGKYLKERPAFTFDPLFHAGCFYVQEASSMFVEKAIRRAVEILDMDDSSLRMLDLCAAPGGKSTLAASVLPEGSLLVANDLIRTRANILAENLIKWGSPNVIITQSDPSAFSALTDFFDIILTDVPCSGEGMFRKDPVAVNEWSPYNVRLCASRQKEILKKCWPALRPGGFLIYSTCTYNTHENEENIGWICENLGAYPVEIPLKDEWEVSGSAAGLPKMPVYRFFPHKTKGEGFFLALLQKNYGEESFSEKGRPGKSKNERKQSDQRQPISDEIRNLIIDSGNFDFSFNRLGQIRAFSKFHLTSLRQLEEIMRIVHAGVVIGEIKGKNFLPDTSLALSAILDINQVQTLELDLGQAISYLRREALVLPETCALDWVLMLFQGKPLGWMKNIGSRANNIWPNEWRIRTKNPYQLD